MLLVMLFELLACLFQASVLVGQLQNLILQGLQHSCHVLAVLLLMVIVVLSLLLRHRLKGPQYLSKNLSYKRRLRY